MKRIHQLGHEPSALESEEQVGEQLITVWRLTHSRIEWKSIESA
jgi:hypothetical protein